MPGPGLHTGDTAVSKAYSTLYLYELYVSGHSSSVLQDTHMCCKIDLGSIPTWSIALGGGKNKLHTGVNCTRCKGPSTGNLQSCEAGLRVGPIKHFNTSLK